MQWGGGGDMDRSWRPHGTGIDPVSRQVEGGGGERHFNGSSSGRQTGVEMEAANGGASIGA